MAVLDLERLPPPARKVLSADASPALRLMAARGVLPGLKPEELVTVMAILARSEDVTVAEAARTGLAQLPAPVLAGAVSRELEPLVIHELARACSDRPEVVEKLVRMPAISGETLELLAQEADERIGEIVATNEQKLLEFPRVIEKLYLNPRVRMSTSDRLLELAVRNGVELALPAFRQMAEAIRDQLVPEPTPEPTFDDLMFSQTEQIARATEQQGPDEDPHQTDEEGEEQVKPRFVPLYAQLAELTVTQKIRRAMLGTSAERMLLVRDPNRLVAEAAVKSPLLQEHEVARIAASRAVLPDVLRIIATNKEFLRNYQVKYNLVTNPRTPHSFALRLVPHLRDSDLHHLARSKEVPAAVAVAVRQHLLRKQIRPPR